jgi:hypothetical protein
MSNSDNKLYFYETTIDLVTTTDQFYVDNRTMDTRHLKAHKGVTNEIIFTVRNRDRKLQNVTSDTVRAHIVKPSTKARVVSRVLTNTTDVGKLMLTLEEGDLANLEPGLYFMYVTRSQVENADRPLYTDQNNNMRFNIEIVDQVGATPVPTQTENTFLQTSNTNLGDPANVYVTNAFYGNLDRNFPDSQHTAAIYLDGYTGNITVQASCQQPVPDTEDLSRDWFDVDLIQVTDANATIKYTSFNVNCEWVRFVSEPDTGTITQVLLRN